MPKFEKFKFFGLFSNNVIWCRVRYSRVRVRLGRVSNSLSSYSITSSTWAARVMLESTTVLKVLSSQLCICLPSPQIIQAKVQIISWWILISSLCRPSPIQYKINNKIYPPVVSKWYLLTFPTAGLTTTEELHHMLC